MPLLPEQPEDVGQPVIYQQAPIDNRSPYYGYSAQAAAPLYPDVASSTVVEDHKTYVPSSQMQGTLSIPVITVPVVGEVDSRLYTNRSDMSLMQAYTPRPRKRKIMCISGTIFIVICAICCCLLMAGVVIAAIVLAITQGACSAQWNQAIVQDELILDDSILLSQILEINIISQGANNLEIVPSTSGNIEASFAHHGSLASAEITYDPDSQQVNITTQGTHCTWASWYRDGAQKLVVKLPASLAASLNITQKGFSATSSIPSLSLRALQAELSAGKMVIKGVSVQESITLKADSGLISAQNLQGKLSLEADSGTIEVDTASVPLSKDFTSKVDSGKIIVKNLRSANVQFEVDSGTLNVDVADLQAPGLRQLDGNVDSGSATVTLRAQDFNGQFTTSVDSGKVEFKAPPNVVHRTSENGGFIGNGGGPA